jgi:hypothetical protein
MIGHYKKIFLLLLLLISVFISSCTISSPEERSTLEHECSDIVVIGRAKTLSYSEMDTENGILRRSIFKIEIRIKRVLYGSEKRKIVNATGVSHGQMREDKDFVFILRPNNGDYQIITAALEYLNPRIASTGQCS